MLVILRTVITKKKKVGIYSEWSKKKQLERFDELDGELEEGEVEEEFDDNLQQKDGMYFIRMIG